MRSFVISVLTGLVVSIVVCRFIEADSHRHVEQHLRVLEERWRMELVDLYRLEHGRGRCAP